MVVITHGEPRHQHAWLPLHKPPTHGKDLALLLMVHRPKNEALFGLDCLEQPERRVDHRQLLWAN